MVLFEWLALPYRLCRVERELRASEAFHRINPLGKVPALSFDHRQLTENSCILQHLAQQKPEAKLAPAAGTPSWDEMNRWLSYLASGFHASFYPFFAPSRYVQDPALYPKIKEAALEQVSKQLDYVNRHLEKHEWVLGEAKSLLDPYLYALSRWAKPLFALTDTHPHLHRHQINMEGDTAVQFALAIEKGEEPPSPSGAFKGHVQLAQA